MDIDPLQIDVSMSHETDPSERLMEAYSKCLNEFRRKPVLMIVSSQQIEFMKNKYIFFPRSEKEKMRQEILKELGMEDPRVPTFMGVKIEVKK